MENFRKLEENPYKDFYWNVPETKQGRMNVVGGNSQRFHAPVKVANLLREKYPIEEVVTVLPESLRPVFGDFPNVIFAAATESGSFRDGAELVRIFNAADFNLLIGDTSRNTVTAKAVAEACGAAKKPVLVTRDAVDVLAEECSEETLLNPNLVIFGSMVQMQKIFRAVYYPKVLLLTQPLLQVVDALHKFTLSYPVTVITFHMGQFLVAKDGEVVSVPLEKTGASVMEMWGGGLAARVAVLNLFNPGKILEASVAGLFLA